MPKKKAPQGYTCKCKGEALYFIRELDEYHSSFVCVPCLVAQTLLYYNGAVKEGLGVKHKIDARMKSWTRAMAPEALLFSLFRV